MNKQSKSKVVKKWKSSKIQVKKDSKGLLWVVLGSSTDRGEGGFGSTGK